MGRIVMNNDYLMCLRMLEIIEWKDGKYQRGIKWATAGDLPVEKFIKLFSKSKRWKYIDAKKPLGPYPQPLETSAALSTLDIINNPVMVDNYLKKLPACRELTMTIKIIIDDDDVKASVAWDSSHGFEFLRSTNKEMQRKFYEQEHFVVRDEICPVVELEESIVRKVSNFFDNEFPVTVVRTHKKKKIV